MKEQWIKLHLEKGMPITELAKLVGRHENTLYLWKANYLKAGIEGLLDKSKTPLAHPNEYPEDIKGKIRLLRSEGLEKEKRYIGEDVIRERLFKRYGIRASHSGIGGFLRRDGLIPEIQRCRRTKKERVKKCKIHEPGGLMQMDVKYGEKSGKVPLPRLVNHSEADQLIL